MGQTRCVAGMKLFCRVMGQTPEQLFSQTQAVLWSDPGGARY
jgi:hypothetical protein